MDEKNKKGKRLPLYIEHAVILGYVVAIYSGIALVQLLVAIGMENINNIAMIIFTIFAPLTGFFIGWYFKFRYVNKKGDDDQRLRIKAQYWGAIAFLITVVLSLLLILMILIKLENSVLPESLPQPIIFALSMSIMAVSLYIANSSRKRIYRNFGYNPL